MPNYEILESPKMITRIYVHTSLDKIFITYSPSYSVLLIVSTFLVGTYYYLFEQNLSSTLQKNFKASCFSLALYVPILLRVERLFFLYFIQRLNGLRADFEWMTQNYTFIFYNNLSEAEKRCREAAAMSSSSQRMCSLTH